jgi:hypothetical protein
MLPICKATAMRRVDAMSAKGNEIRSVGQNPPLGFAESAPFDKGVNPGRSQMLMLHPPSTAMICPWL